MADVTLTPTQQKIVDSNESHIMCIAASGSGKTRTLTERIRRLIYDGVDPIGIIAITFTRTAAEEMKERLSVVSGSEDSFIGTIHALAHKVLRTAGDDFKILSDEVNMELHQYLIEKYCKSLTYKQFLTYMDNRAKIEMGLMDESRLLEALPSAARDELYKIHRKESEGETLDKNYPETIESLCKQRNIISFDELLRRTTKFFTENQVEIDHVLVDEFQDIGLDEYKFIKSLKAKNYFFCGDDFQSIFGFKGGCVEIFTSLVKDKTYKTFYLVDNWRSAPNIIKEAAEVISQVPDRIMKEVVATRSDCEGEVVWASMKNLEELLGIIKQAKVFGDWFFLVRTNKDLQEVGALLYRNGIPHSTFRRAGMSLENIRKEMSKNTIKLMTVHMSKGLESKYVALIGKSFVRRAPSYRNQSEERKVMYVGMTRAKDELCIFNR